MPVIGKLQMDLLAMALACDMTRVASIMWANSATNKPTPWLNIPEGHHEVAHRGDDDMDAREKLTLINTWYAEQFAYLIAKLKSMPEGEGSVLDNTLLIWVNEHQKGNDHDRDQIPLMSSPGRPAAPSTPAVDAGPRQGPAQQPPGRLHERDGRADQDLRQPRLLHRQPRPRLNHRVATGSITDTGAGAMPTPVSARAHDGASRQPH